VSYYIAESERAGANRLVMYRVVKRLRDFKADDGVEYMVFKSRKAIKHSFFIDLYIGKNGKLVKLKNKSMMRF